MADEKKGEKKKDKKKEKKPDMTFFHPDLFEIPEDGSPPFLKGWKCKKCGQVDFPKLSPCPNCWSEEFEMNPLSRKGTLYSFSDIYVGVAGLETPYIIGYIDLPEDIRVFAQLDGEAGTYKCGDEVELTYGPVNINRDGNPIISYRFKKAS